MSEALATFSDGTAVPTDGEFHVDPSRPQSSVKYLKSWHPPGVSEVLSGGNTARLALLPDGTILKYVYDRDNHWAMKGLDIEHHILTALGSHERLIKYFGQHEYGLRFQFEANGDIRRYFSRTDFKTIPIQERKKWVQQAAESVAFIYSKQVCLQNATISHTIDNFTQAAALFSGIEAKPPNGGAVKAQV